MPGPAVYVAVTVGAMAAVIVFKQVCTSTFLMLHTPQLIVGPLVRIRPSCPSKVLRLEGLS